MTRPTPARQPAKTARWVSVSITSPMTDTLTEGVIAVRPGLLPAKLHLTSGPRPSDEALATIAALCAVGRARYVSFQLGDGSIIEVDAIARHRGRAALEGAVVTVPLPEVDARAVLAEGPVTVEP